MRTALPCIILFAVAFLTPDRVAIANDPEPMQADALQKAPGKEGKTGVRHPNLYAAQKLSAQAFAKLEAAQQANEYDLGGHAQKAKELLEQVNAEIDLALARADAKKR
jgi:hypothetical protein